MFQTKALLLLSYFHACLSICLCLSNSLTRFTFPLCYRQHRSALQTQKRIQDYQILFSCCILLHCAACTATTTALRNRDDESGFCISFSRSYTCSRIVDSHVSTFTPAFKCFPSFSSSRLVGSILTRLDG